VINQGNNSVSVINTKPKLLQPRWM
jgi:hypothetical protein